LDWKTVRRAVDATDTADHLGFFEDEFGLRTRYDIGVDVITFECDYPHQDSTWPHTRAYAEKIFAGVPDDEVWKIVRGNAIEMLGLDPDRPGPSGPSGPLGPVGAHPAEQAEQENAL
jgi:hypothetical protein